MQLYVLIRTKIRPRLEKHADRPAHTPRQAIVAFLRRTAGKGGFSVSLCLPSVRSRPVFKPPDLNVPTPLNHPERQNYKLMLPHLGEPVVSEDWRKIGDAIIRSTDSKAGLLQKFS